MIPVSVPQIIGTFNSDLKYVEWLDENVDTPDLDWDALERAFNAARGILQEEDKFFANHYENLRHNFINCSKFKDFETYKAYSLTQSIKK